jgi:hypothetical protein
MDSPSNFMSRYLKADSQEIASQKIASQEIAHVVLVYYNGAVAPRAMLWIFIKLIRPFLLLSKLTGAIIKLAQRFEKLLQGSVALKAACKIA